MSDLERRYQPDRGTNPATLTEEQIKAELKWLAGSDACGSFRQWEIEARKFRLSFELRYRNGAEG